MRNRCVLVGLCYVASLLGITDRASAQDIARLTQGHAHNDYLHERPLLAALESGFNSVEADVFLVDGQLLVAHTAKEIKSDRTLQKLYLEPLKARVAANAGHVYDSPSNRHRPFWLLIDIKSEAEATYRRLHEVLEFYAHMLTSVEGEKVTPGAIQVVISGNHPQEFIAAQPKRYCGIDGRISDLDSSQPAHLTPMISDNWGLQFLWRGSGPMPALERLRLDDVVKRSHDKGRVVRFWATPENENVWKALVESKVDWINTDQLKVLSSFLNELPTGQLLTKVPFEVKGHAAFLIAAQRPASGKPWVWYAPTLGANLPGEGHHWYFERFLKAGISIAGIDLGEVRGSPASNAKFLSLHDEMVQRGYSAKPVLLGQSRGGLMMLSFAARYPDKLSAFVGIYPVCNLSSWPLQKSKSSTLADYGMSEAELTSKLIQYNPVDNLEGLIKNKVPIFTVHGDEDLVVPLDENSGLLKSRYEAGGGSITVKIIPGEGHKVSKSFFECQELVDFVSGLAAEPPFAVAISESKWKGFSKQSFRMDDHAAFVVVPLKPATGKPWIWRTSFPDFHPEVDHELVKQGFHIAYIDVVSMLGADQSLDIMDRFYALVRKQWGLAEKPALEPCSRGGLHAYRYAARHPDRIACIFGDVPVMDLKSWPLQSPSAKGPLQDALKYYGFKNEDELKAYDGNPIDVLAPIAKARIPLRHIVSPNDTVVPPDDNTLLAKRRLNELGWDLEVVTVNPKTTINSGHHYPMIEIEQSVRFVIKHAMPTKP